MGLAKRTAWAVSYLKNQFHFTWEELGKELGTNKNTIAAYADGKGLIKGEVVEKLVMDFSFHSAWLLEGRGEPFPGARKNYPEACGDPYIHEDTKPLPEYGRKEAFDKDGLWGKTQHHEVEGDSFAVTTFEPDADRQDGPQTQTISGVTREEHALIQALRFCGPEYTKMVYIAATVKAQNTMEEKKLEKKERLNIGKILETLTTASIK